jgi:5-methyltetrahydrofolate--homocysteine methyltransferase
MMKNDWTPNTDLFLDHLINGKTGEALSITKKALDNGLTPEEFFNKFISPVLERVGVLFEELEIFLPEMTQAGEIIKKINEEILEPEIERRSHAGEIDSHPVSKVKVLLATVQGDIHDIGKNMVGLMLRVNGFEVIDIGTDVPPLEIVACAKRENVDIIGLSSLLTTCLPYMTDVIRYLESNNIRENFKIIIGGASPTAEFADDIGADGFGQSASAAVSICKNLMNGEL